MRRRAAVTIACGLAAAALLLSGCERNAAESFLVPTGVRPRPEVGTGSIQGRIVFDPVQSPDLVPPYPPGIIRLFENGVAVDSMPIDRATATFTFDSLHPAVYTVVADPHMYERSSVPPVRVVSEPVDIGDLATPFDLDEVKVSIHLVMSFAPKVALDTTSLQQTRLGVWLGPQIDAFFPPDGGEEIPGDTAIVLTAGEYDLRFMINEDLESYYGGAGTAVIDVPVVDVPIDFRGPDLRVRIPADGRYRFQLDERRLMVTIEQLPASGSLAARRRAP